MPTDNRISSDVAVLILECRNATQAYRDAWTKADTARQRLRALGLCAHCSIGEHGRCADYGCTCCGGGK